MEDMQFSCELSYSGARRVLACGFFLLAHCQIKNEFAVLKVMENANFEAIKSPNLMNFLLLNMHKPNMLI